MSDHHQIKTSPAKHRTVGSVSTFFQRAGGYLATADFYGESVSFSIKNGESVYTSVVGTLISLIVLALTFSYGIQQLIVMLDYAGTSHMYIARPLVNAGRVFSQKETNFNIAIGLQEAAGWNPKFIDPEGYLKPVFYRGVWRPDYSTLDDQGNFNMTYVADELETRRCTAEDFENGNFYEPGDIESGQGAQSGQE